MGIAQQPRHRIRALTHLYRPVDLQHWTGRAVVLVAVLGATIHGIAYGGGADGTAELLLVVSAGLLVGPVVWALSRELIPEDLPTAVVAAIVAVGASVMTPEFSLVLPFTLLLLVLVLTQSVGPAKIQDLVFVGGLLLWGAQQSETVLLWVGGCMAFGLDAVLASRRSTARNRIFSAASAILLGVAGVFYSSGKGSILKELAFFTLRPQQIIWVAAVAVISAASSLLFDLCPAALTRKRPLQPPAGVFVPLLIVAPWVGVLSLFHGSYGFRQSILLWTTLGVTGTLGWVRLAKARSVRGK